MKLPFQLKRPAVVVFEGLDGTGKSTQHERMEAGVYRPTDVAPMFDGEPKFLHMPSGSNLVGQMVYDLTERADHLDPFSRQLLHLASHATEIQEVVLPALAEPQAVFLDRFWWSTVAYGSKPLKGRYSRRELLNLCEKVWQGVEPDVVYLFMDPWVKDKNNKPHVKRTYEWLAEQYPDIVTLVPGPGERTAFDDPYHEANTQLFILEDMVARGLYTEQED